MHEDILDHEPKKSEDYYYQKSKKNLIVSLALILLVAIIIYFSFLIIGLNSLLPIMVGVMILSAIFNSFKGVYNGIQSYRKKEKPKAWKPVILVGNIIIAGLFSMGIIANLVDLMRLI